MELWKRSVAGLAIALGAAAVCVPSVALAQDAKPGAKAPADDGVLDEIIFRNGNKVQGKVLSETGTEVRVRVMIAGISTETAYAKSEILEIKRGAIKPAAKPDESKDTGTKSDTPKTDEAKKESDPSADEVDGKIVDRDGKAIPPGNLKVYVVSLAGEFGRVGTKTPMKKIMDDAARIQPDVIIFKFDYAYQHWGEEKVDFQADGDEGAFDMLETARELDTLITDRVAGGDFKTKPRMVAWIKKAMGGAAFLPCVFPEIYFTPDGLQGGLGGLEALFDQRGDEVVREKQRSLRLARAKGLVNKGGHDETIMEAMSRRDFWLSYKLEGGKVLLKTEKPDSPDWVLLKDDGEGVNADVMQDIVRMQGNDYLNLNAKIAQTLGWSKGTAETLDDLIYAMGIERNFSVVKNKAGAINKGWADDVKKGEEDINKLLDKLGRVRVREPGGAKERNAARGQRIAILQQMLPILDTYKEAINPQKIQGWPPRMERDIRIVIARLKLEISNDKDP